MRSTGVECNSCGAQLTISGGIGECVFCGNVTKTDIVDAVNAASDEGQLPELFELPVTISDDQFEESFKEHVINKDPAYIVDQGNTEFSAAIFLRFEGNISGTFTCLAGRERINYVTRSNGDRTWSERRVDIEYAPFSSPFRADFVIDLCVGSEYFSDDEITGEIFPLAEWLESSTKTQTIQSAALSEEDISNFREQLQTALASVENGRLISTRLLPLIEEAAQSAAYDAAPDPCKDITPVYEYTIAEYTPFLAYHYTRSYVKNGEEMYFIVDAGDGTFTGEADEPGAMELAGRSVKGVVSSLKKWFS
jgi:hypothetical protein